MGKRNRRRKRTVPQNEGLNGNDPGFKFFAVSKILSYTDKPVLIIVPPHVVEECGDSHMLWNPVEQNIGQKSIVRAMRAFFLNRAMELHTAQSVADCCIDAMLAAEIGIPGVVEISEQAANSGSGFDSMMSINCQLADLKNPAEAAGFAAHRAAGGQ